MRSLRVLTLLLVVVVLLPAGILGWLGIQGTDRFAAEMRQRIEQELEIVGQSAKGILAEFVEDDARDADARVAAAAELLARRLPFERVGRALNEAKHVLYVGSTTGPESGAEFDLLWQFSKPELRVIDATGRQVLPVTFDPDGAAKGRSDPDRLFDDLSREADAACFGRNDLAGALAIWKDAAARFTEPVWKARAEIESLRLEGPYSISLSDLGARYPKDVLVSVGRPWVLLMLRTLSDGALRALDDDGRLAETPLTEIERDWIRERLDPSDVSGPERVVGGHDTHRAALPGGLVLEVTRRWRSLLAGPAGALVERWRARLPASAHVELAESDARPRASDRSRIVERSLDVPRPGSPPASASLTHRDEARLLTEVGGSRRWTIVGVLSLVGVIGLGLLVGRSALAREREARRLKDDFLANVSHELRTPLTSVCLHADLLAESGLSNDQRLAHAEVVRAEGARLSALVDDLLDFAALERGSRRLEPEPVDLAAAAERALAPLRVLAAREGVSLSLKLPPGETLGLADPLALGRILSNLVGNAWKHGRPARDGGPGQIAVRVRSMDVRPTLEVIDDGPGIPASERARLFERFQRGAESARTRGVGLGLALSRELARAMGGELAVVEDPTRTVLRLTLPPVPPPESPA